MTGRTLVLLTKSITKSEILLHIYQISASRQLLSPIKLVLLTKKFSNITSELIFHGINKRMMNISFIFIIPNLINYLVIIFPAQTIPQIK